MPVKVKRVFDPPEKNDGERILVDHFWPRGVKMEAIDEWRRELGSPPDLIKDWKGEKITWSEFTRRYREEAVTHGDAIKELADRAKRETISLLCSSSDINKSHCVILKEMVEKAMH